MVRRDVEAGGRRRKSRDALTSRPEIERLLDAASAPASPRELAGEHAAVDLFARARLVSAAAAAGPPSRSPRAGLKAAAAAVAAVVAMSSGVAFAATGHVPFADAIKQVTRQVTGHGSDDNGSHDGANGQNPGSHGHQKQGDDANVPHGPRAAALHGLCRAYARGQKATHGHALEARPFSALVTAAGGAEQVEDFCASLPPKPQENATHPSHPTHPAHPSNGPSDGSTPSDLGTHPTKPAHPTHPASPTHQPKPSHPDSPTHQPKPSHPDSPTHKPQPSHSPRPTDKPSHTAKPHPTH